MYFGHFNLLLSECAPSPKPSAAAESAHPGQAVGGDGCLPMPHPSETGAQFENTAAPAVATVWS